MSLVSTKCPNCGASIMLDAGSKEGFCTYCGSKLKVQEVINQVRIDKTGDAANYLAMAEAAYQGNNAEEAYEYANKALELDAKNPQAWYAKLLALEVFARTRTEKRAKEALACGNKIIELDPSMKKEVYRVWLTHARNFMGYSVSGGASSEASGTSSTDDDDNIVINVTVTTVGNSSKSQSIETVETELMMLRRAVPTEEIVKDETLTKLVLDLAQCLDNYQYDVHKHSEYRWRKEHEQYEQYLSEILEGLPDEVKGIHANFTPYVEPSKPKSKKKEPSTTQEMVGCAVIIVCIWLFFKACSLLM